MEPSITCISCNRTSYAPKAVAAPRCRACGAEHQGSIIWRAEEDPKITTGYVGSAQMFRITALEARRFTLGTATLGSIFYEQSGRYDKGPNAFSTVDGAKEWASVLMARLVRKMFFSKTPSGTYGTSGGVPVTDELVERLADKAEAGYGEDELHELFATSPMETAADADALFDRALELKREAEKE